MKRNIFTGSLLALALCMPLCAAAEKQPAAPSFTAPNGTMLASGAAAPSSTQHYNSFTYAASADSTAASPGTTNLYRVSGSCSATLSSYSLVSGNNAPSASATPVYDTSVKAGDVFSYVVTAVIGGIESKPSNCVTATTPTFSVGGLAVTTN